MLFAIMTLSSCMIALKNVVLCARNVLFMSSRGGFSPLQNPMHSMMYRSEVMLSPACRRMFGGCSSNESSSGETTVLKLGAETVSVQAMMNTMDRSICSVFCL